MARAVALLNLLADRPDRSFTLSQLARALEMNKATAHTLLATLREARYVERDDATMGYTLGAALVGLGQAVLTRDHLLHLARLAVNRLSREISHPSVVVVVVDDELVVVGVADREHVHTDRAREGSRLPLTPPLGTAFAAWWPPERVDRWLAKLESPLSDDEVMQYRQLLASIRERGYSVDLSDTEVRLQAFLDAVATGDAGQLRSTAAEIVNRSAHAQAYNVREFADADTYHVEAMSVPIFGADGGVAAAISAFIGDDLTGQAIRTLGAQLLEAARGVDGQDVVDHASHRAAE